MAPKLEPSPIIREFLGIMRRGAILPAGARLLQPMLVRAAIALLPGWARTRLGLRPALRPGETQILRRAARLAHRIRLDAGPAAQACIRLGLPPDHLQRRWIQGLSRSADRN
jgi:uncharacterized protein (DUF2236 family)